MKIFKDKRAVLCLAAMVFVGVLLMLGSNAVPHNATVKKGNDINNNDYNLEERLSNILSQVEGAGNVRVMITYSTGSEKIIAYNTDSEKDNDRFTSRESNEAVINNDGPVVIKEIYPSIEGVLIVAQGGGNTEVKNNLINASKALLGIDVNKIEVLIMKREA